jgi:hypothetical protein
MKTALALLVIAACGGPTQQQLAETPSAQSQNVTGEAPPASTSDKDRERSVQQFDDMETTQNAYHEAGINSGSGEPKMQTPPPAPNAKKAPVEQAPLPKKKAPVEQAPK